MTRVVVDVMLKPEILDPQGQAIARALPRLGFDGIKSVRQGKRFEIEFAEPPGPAEPTVFAQPPERAEAADSTPPADGTDASQPPTAAADDVRAKARQIAETLLANPVIEDFEVRVVQ